MEVDAQGAPVALTPMKSGRRMQVVSIEDLWRIDDEWWRERPVARMYYRVITREGRAITIFHDLLEGVWRRQWD